MIGMKASERKIKMRKSRFIVFCLVCLLAFAGVMSSATDAAAASKCYGGDVVAAASGTVVLVQKNNGKDHGMGNTVIIKHKIVGPGGTPTYVYSLYAHLYSIVTSIANGKYLIKGTKIGVMGATANGSACTGTPYLHFEIKNQPVLGNHYPVQPDDSYEYTPASADSYNIYNDPNDYIGQVSTVSSTTSVSAKLNLTFTHPTHTPQACLYNEDCKGNGSFHTGIDYTSVSNTAFNEDFTNTDNSTVLKSWSPDYGSWAVLNDPADGIPYYTASSNTKNGYSVASTYNSIFANTTTSQPFTFKVKMRRKGGNCKACADRALVMASGNMGTIGTFANEYAFQINQNGYYSVYAYSSTGGQRALKNWTFSSAINKGEAWNELKVTVNKTKWTFYVNGIQVWTGTAYGLTSGAVGFGMYDDTSSKTPTTFEVQSASLN